MAATQKVDIVVHVDETLDEGRRSNIESTLRQEDGVVWARFTNGRPHLMMVEYDPELTSSISIQQKLCNHEHLHAELIGGL
jgi:hypothetical protein